jgi:hypothetical protein
MEHKFFLIVKVTVRSNLPQISDMLHELQSKTQIQLSSTKNVQVLKHEIVGKKLKTH